MKTKKVALYGLMIALAFLLSYIETLIPFVMPVPGMKIGLANLAIITALYELGEKDAVILSLIRVVLVAFTFSNMSAMLYSLAGAALSILVMILLKKSGKFSMTGVSVAGGIAHNAGQIVVAAWMLGTARIVYYLPWLVLSGLVAGIVIGLVGAQITVRIHKVYHTGM